MSLRWLVPAAVLLVVAGLWFWRKKPRQAPPRGIVLLLRRAKALDVQRLSELLAKAAGRPIRAVDIDADAGRDSGQPADDVVFGRARHFAAQVGGSSFLILDVSEPYMDVGDEIGELRLRKAVKDHKAWLSMDILRPAKGDAEAYRLVGRFLAESCDDDCLALYHPESNRMVACSAGETVERLRSEDPVKALFEQLVDVPVVPIDDDPRLKAAEAEARRRFPEFATALETDTGKRFSVKARISRQGKAEHIWIEVGRMADGKITGRLGNEPVELTGLRLGSEVEIETGEVEDWVFERDGKPVGMFTVPVIQQILEERSRKK